MKSVGATIVKNASALLGSQLVTWVLTLALTLVLPRYVGPSGLGELQIAQSIWAILGVLIACGMDTLLVKEIARAPERAGALLSTSFLLRGSLFVLACLAAAAYVRVQHFSGTLVVLVALCAVNQLISQLSSASTAALQGLEIMEYVSIATIVSKVVNTILGITVLLIGYGVYGIAIASMVAMVVLLAIQLVVLQRRAGLSLRYRGGLDLRPLRAGAPYLFSGLTLVLYTQVDTLVISTMVNTTVVGWYSAAMVLFATLLFIPVALTSSVFPTMTRLYTTEPQRVVGLMRRSFDLILLVSVPIGLGLVVVGQPLMALLYGPAFAPSGTVLMILGLVIPMTYANILLGQFLISTDRQNSWTVVMVVATLVTIPLDLWLVPLCQQTYGNGAIGGALSFVIAELGMTLAGIVLMPRGTLSLTNAWAAARIFLAGGVMVAACWWSRELFLAVPVLIGAVTYVALIVLLRVVSNEDLAIVKGLAQRVRERLRRRNAEPIGI